MRAHGLPAPLLDGRGPGWTLVEFVAGRRPGGRDDRAPVEPRAVRALAAMPARLHAPALPEGPFPRATTASALAIMREHAAAGDVWLRRLVERLRPLDEEPPVFEEQPARSAAKQPAPPTIRSS